MSAAIGAWIALCGFWVLLAVGVARGELGIKGAATFIVLWLVGFVGARDVLYGQLFAPYVAVLDIALVLVVFKGDVKLT